jgi:hypothetical protein
MRPPRRSPIAALLCLSNFCLSHLFLASFCLSGFAPAQQSDQVIAERILGPQWKQLSRRAGMIFAGTVLVPVPQIATTQASSTSPLAGAMPSLELSFRVDEGIAGVERGQILTIHEWTGAWSMQRPMAKGQHILLFLYPPSRLGLTSPVGGSLGQVALDSSGKNVSNLASPRTPISSDSVTVLQLERAIRSARAE